MTDSIYLTSDDMEALSKPMTADITLSDGTIVTKSWQCYVVFNNQLVRLD